MPTAKEQLQTALRENDPGAINKALDRIREESGRQMNQPQVKGIHYPQPYYPRRRFVLQ